MSDGLLDAREQLTGEVLGVVYADRDQGFGVVEIDREDREEAEPARCAGPLADLVDGQTVRLVGRWRTHPRYGPTFEAVYYEQLTPSTVAGLRSFLYSERFQSVRAGVVDRVLTAFGAGAGTAIEQGAQRLVDGAGLHVEDAEALHDAWQQGQALAALVRLVEPSGWPLDVVRAVYAHHGVDAVRAARDDPYRLLDIERVRFAHVDRLASHLGISPTDPRRLAAGAHAAVTAARSRDGHQHLPRRVCLDAASRLLGVDRLLAGEGLERALGAGLLAAEEVDGADVVAPPGAFAVEQQLADELVRLLTARGPRLRPAAPFVTPSPDLTSGQAAAVRATFEHPVAILTGGPGTGKTRTIQEVVAAVEAAELEVAMCAPTGRAAKRLEELVGRAATTVHRLLEARPTAGGGFTFRYGASERLPLDLIVVDEVSMCDTWLAARLVAAVDDGAHLLLVGDADQLPSVGPGDVLRDLIRSRVVPVTELTEIHRQAADSRIVGLAREVLEGELGRLPGVDGDVFFAEEPRAGAIVPRVVQTVVERAPAYFDVAVDAIQVLAPVYRGVAGVDALNAALKAALNPPASRPELAGFHVGDRVMQTRNDAELDVANGDVGHVVDLSPRDATLRVAFPRGEVTYDRGQARELVAAWAVTVHKAQGGEWPVVVLVCDRSHRSMLWRNLAYTAITRAARALIVIGQRDALHAAAGHDRPSGRATGLAWRLRRAQGSDDEDGASPPSIGAPATSGITASSGTIAQA